MVEAPNSRYRILEHLSSGSSAQVYLAQDVEGGESVVLKMLHAHGRWKTIGLNEFSLMLSLDHPRIVRCLDYAYHESQSYMAMEYISGGPLRNYMGQDWQWSQEALICLAQEILEGLEYLHDKGLTHCDLKPENILIDYDGESSHYKLTDFGISQKNEYLKQKRDRDGSPAYMAPEQFYDRFGPQADLFSLGVILYEMISGERPFDGTPEEIIRQHRHGIDFGLLSTHSLEPFLRRLLEMDPKHRIASAEEALYILKHVDDFVGAELPKLNSENAASTRCTYFEGPHNLHQCSTISLPEAPKHLLPINHGAQPTLVVDHGDHLVFYCATTGKINRGSRDKKALAPFAPAQANGVVYLKKTGIVHYDPVNDYELILQDDCLGAKSFTITPDLNHVAWHDDQRIHYQHRSSGKQYALPASHYGLGDGLGLFPDGRLWIVGNALRPTLKVMSQDGELLDEAMLPGPVVEHSHNGERLFFICLSHDDSSSYLFCYDQSLSEAVQLPTERIAQVRFTSHAAILLLNNHELLRYDQKLSPQYLGRMPDQPDDLLFSPDQRFVFLINQEARGITVSTFQNDY